MSADFSRERKRYNYLLSETDAAYHEASTILDTGDPCPLRDICRYAGISKQTINSTLRRLEADGMIYLENTDGKNKTVYLTDKGRKLAERTAAKVIAIENDIFASWDTEDVDRYLLLTDRYLQDFRDRLQYLT